MPINIDREAPRYPEDNLDGDVLAQVRRLEPIEPFSVNDLLPVDGTWVLAHYNGDNWGEDKGQYWVVAKFIRGLSKADRQALSDTDERKQTIKAQDELGNNQRAFCWTTFGHPHVVSQGSKVGQAVDYWMPLPTTPEKGNTDDSQVQSD